MLRFFLRLLVLASIGFGVALWTVPLLLQERFSNDADAYYRDAVRGPLFTLGELLQGRDAAQREAELQRLAPHYGPALELLAADAVRPRAEEQRALEQFGLLARNEQQDFYRLLPGHAGAPAQWLHLRLPSSPPLDPASIALAVLLLVSVSAAFLLAWAWPTWRDLQRLGAASMRMGEGDLNARARISERSSVAPLARQFNQMGERIASLVARQRELTNDVSHELRTPIARLQFELDLLSAETCADARRQLLQEMREDLRGLDELVGELLFEARLEHVGRRLQQEHVDAPEWLQDQLRVISRDAQGSGVTCEVVECAPPQVQLHPHYMARATLNLLRNALAHARSRVRLQLQRDGDHWQLRVCDDGPGIAAADRERVFQPFTRLDLSRQRTTGGVGLGLAMVARIVACHHGSVRVEDSALGGASFVMRWPVAALH
ncbi:MAG: HAMP domain-containing protein [Stenotrophomonas maltophilia]|uniref:ATP-binding protein n=1 Tax=Stenotrophomonas TaxID=40323 RepID=UPI001310EFB7|nr:MULTISPECIES: ATP-binding protein [Stenotrophomonas]MBS4801010.1 HAMP domain-containing protein [Stenotrophomonas maltophilia]MDG9990290.1 ATP-binding protein [Stenotrophomonas sp. GD04024]